MNESEKKELNSIHAALIQKINARVQQLQQKIQSNDYVPPGFISELYAPLDMNNIQQSDRCFYTPYNANYLDVARQLKKRNAGRIFIASTFGLFTGGLKLFDEAHAEGVFDKVLTTNLIYQMPELLSKDYYINCDMSKYIAYIIDTLNHDTSISDLLVPSERIQNIVARYNNGEEIS